MSGVHIAAAITTVVALGVWGIPIWWRASRTQALKLVVALLCTLPMCALAYYVVRQPLIGLVTPLVGSGSNVNTWLATLWAPLTEEPAKLWPLLIPWLRRDLSDNDRLRLGLALGLGFGLGEIWFVVHALVPAHQADLAWYMYSGLILERFVVCLMHGFFTTMAVWRLGRKFIVGVLIAMVAHFFLNFPIILMHLDVGGIGQGWAVLVQGWIGVGFLVAGGVLLYLRFGRKAPEDASGEPRFMLWHILAGLLSISCIFFMGLPALALSIIAHLDWKNGEKEQARRRLRIARGVTLAGWALTVITAIGSAVWFIAIIPPPPPTVEITGDEREEYLQFADPVVDNLMEGYDAGDFDHFARDFDDAMKTAMRPSFDGVREKVSGAYGPHKSHAPEKVERRGEYVRVVYKGVFGRNDSVKIRVVFSGEGDARKVTGLRFYE